MVRDVLSRFVNNVPDEPKPLSIESSNILGITLLTIEEAKELPENIRTYGKWYWLKDVGYRSNSVATVYYSGTINHHGYSVNDADGTVRPLLLTNLKSDNLQLYDTYKIFDIEWYYIGDGKFLSFKSIGYYRFNDDPYFIDWWSYKISDDEYFSLCEKADLNNYEKSKIKQYLENWLEERLYEIK